MPFSSDTLDSWDAFDDDEHGSLDEFDEEDPWYIETQEELESGWYWEGDE